MNKIERDAFRKTKGREAANKNKAKSEDEQRVKQKLNQKKLKEFFKRVETRDEHNYIYLCRSNGDWWMMGGVSALIYFYKLVPKLDLRNAPKLRENKDWHKVVGSGGVVNFMGKEGVKANLAGIGIEVVKESDDLVMFDLKFVVKKEEIEELKLKEQVKRSKINDTVMPKLKEVELYNNLRDLNKLIFHATRKMDTYTREYKCAKLDEMSDAIFDTFVLMEKGRLEISSGIRIMENKMALMQAGALRMMNNNIWTVDKCAKVNTVLAGIEERLKILKKKQEKVIKGGN